MERHDAVVVGAGHAGLSASQRLAAAGVEHVVLERDRIGASWRSQRWDTFRLNTPAWANRLPGDTDADLLAPADAFNTAAEFADRLAAYAAGWGLPVREGTAVTAVEPTDAGFEVDVGARGGDRLAARTVVLASGIQNVPRIPPIADLLPGWLVQVPALGYRNAAELPDGAVLVAGGGQTGCQIVEDLLDAGRRVYLSPSRVPRLRRRHRGRDAFEWLAPAGFFRVRRHEVTEPAELRARQPLISGVGRHGHSVSLQWLASRGATLVGRMRSVEGDAVLLDDTVADCVRFGDEASARVRLQLDRLIEGSGSELPPLEDDPADEAHPDPDGLRSPDRLDLRALGIRSVVWATGVRGDFGWLPGRLLDADGAPGHATGRTAQPGLFVLGFPWLTCRGSGIVMGAAGDAQLVADAVVARLA